MAEISVPAWPIPIQKTKLMIGQAQPSVSLLPHMPMPRKTTRVRDTSSMDSMPRATTSATYQALGMRRHGRSTTSETVSVTNSKYLDASAALLMAT